MREKGEYNVGTIATLNRFPVKSMLGECRERLTVTHRGLVGDRTWAVLDIETGKVASAKRPKLWRNLLACTARSLDDGDTSAVEIELPDGRVCRADDPGINDALSVMLGRRVQLANVPPQAASLDRSHPEMQLSLGLDEDAASDILEMGASAPPSTFFDYASLHLITSATLTAISEALPGEPVEAIRYRPNVTVASPPDAAPFPENEWAGGTLRIGQSLELRVVLQTPRCVVPTLAHGALPPRPAALLAAVRRNRLDVPGFGAQACAGVYAEVLHEGTISEGDPVRFIPGMGQ